MLEPTERREVEERDEAPVKGNSAPAVLHENTVLGWGLPINSLIQTVEIGTSIHLIFARLC